MVRRVAVVVAPTGLPQWAVVGDNFPVGCRFDETIVFHEYFEANPDHHDPRYNTKVRARSITRPRGVYSCLRLIYALHPHPQHILTAAIATTTTTTTTTTTHHHHNNNNNNNNPHHHARLIWAAVHGC
jgi:hypothetical protein